VLDQFCSSLGPKTVEALICAQDWLQTSTIYIDVKQFMDDMEKYEAGNYIYSLHLSFYFIIILKCWTLVSNLFFFNLILIFRWGRDTQIDQIMGDWSLEKEPKLEAIFY